jgi:hypothetical protein
MKAIISTVVKATRQALPASARVEASSLVWFYPQTGMGLVGKSHQLFSSERSSAANGQGVGNVTRLTREKPGIGLRPVQSPPPAVVLPFNLPLNALAIFCAII